MRMHRLDGDRAHVTCALIRVDLRIDRTCDLRIHVCCMAEGKGGSGVGEGKPPNVKPDLLKPLIFPNHQRSFKIFNFVVAAGTT